MEPEEHRVRSGARLSADMRVFLFMGILAAPLLLAIPLTLTGGYATELTPNHSEAVETTAIYGGLTAAVAAFVAVLLLKPPLRAPLVVGALLAAFGASLGYGLLTATLVGRALEARDFSQAPIVESERYLPISRAWTSEGKGAHYHVALHGYAAELDVSRRDYAKAFHDAEKSDGHGFCLHAKVQQSGEALRVLHRPINFRTGSVVPCPDGAPAR